jgi:hypothetical protein
MNPTIVGMIVFICPFAGALFGMWLRGVLPEHHLNGAGHILNNDLRISGNLFWQVTSHQPGQQIAAASSRSIINDANGLVFVKRTS